MMARPGCERGAEGAPERKKLVVLVTSRWLNSLVKGVDRGPLSVVYSGRVIDDPDSGGCDRVRVRKGKGRY